MTAPERIAFDLTSRRAYPRFMVYTRPETGGDWVERKMLDRFAMDDNGAFTSYIRQPGCIVRSVQRVLIPAIGQAVFEVPYGTINGKTYGNKSDSSGFVGLDEQWDWLHHQVRIDALHDDGSTWNTIYWGTIEQQRDRVPPAWVLTDDTTGTERTIYPQGVRTYTCMDLWAQTDRRLFDKAYYVTSASSAFPNTVKGALGFNVNAGGTGLAPNRGNSTWGTRSTYAHCPPGDPDAGWWTDADAIEYMLTIMQDNSVEPLTLDDSSSLLAGRGAWPVTDGRPIRHAMEPILRRERGLGCAFIDWDDTTLTKSSVAYLRIYPQLTNDLAVDAISGSVGGVTVEGASTAGTSQDLALTGDHRIYDGSFSTTSAQDMQVDAIETSGERIQVVVSLSVEGSSEGGGLSQGWTSAAQTALGSATGEQANASIYEAVYRLLIIDPAWDMATLYNTERFRIDYQCNDDGSILSPRNAGGSTSGIDTALSAAPPYCRLLRYTPCPQSIDLETGVASSGAASKATGALHPTAWFYRVDTDEFITFDVPPNGARPMFSDDGIYLAPTNPAEGPNRASAAWWNKLVVRCGIELPHRPRLYSKRPGAGVPRRTVRIQVPGCHLWLGHRSAMVGIENDATATRVTTAAPLIYRDDRSMLQYRHALAKAWFFQERRMVRWVYRNTCALVPTFTDGTGAQNHPKLGHVISTLRHSGRLFTTNTVVSAITYSGGHTEIQTDWAGLA